VTNSRSFVILEEASTSLDFVPSPARQSIELRPTHMENCIKFSISQMALKELNVC